jgi:hypothetical protein
MSGQNDRSYFGKANIQFTREYANRIYSADNEEGGGITPPMTGDLIQDNGFLILQDNGFPILYTA